MKVPEYWEDDEAWAEWLAEWDRWLAEKEREVSKPPDEFMSGIRKAIQKARGDPADDVEGSIRFLNEASKIITGRTDDETR